MKKTFSYIGFILSVTFIFFTCSTFQLKEFDDRALVKPVADPVLSKVVAEYDKLFEKGFQKSKTPGAAVAIVKGDDVIYAKGFGVKKIGTKESVDINTVFRLASVSKGFAPVLTGTLVEDGLLKWDDKLQKYLPDFSLKSKEKTKYLELVNILGQTTGLPKHAYTDLIEECFDYEYIKDHLQEVSLIGKPGEHYSYQNVAYSLIGDVLKKATGKTYSELLKERIFRPLKMNDASTDYWSVVDKDNVAMPHVHYGRSFKEIENTSHYYSVVPAAGVNASASDMAKYMLALLGNYPEVIEEKTLGEIFTPRIKTARRNRHYASGWKAMKKAYYAMGWRVYEFANDTIVGHSGYVKGYKSEIAIHPKEKIGICVVSNAPTQLSGEMVPPFFKLYMDAMKKEKLKTPAVMAKP